MIVEPTIQELIDVSAQAIRGSAEKCADFMRGSDFESLLGPAAIVWSREAQRDTDLFKAVNFNTAEGSDLTELVYKRYGIERVLDTYGTGQAVLERPAGGIAETIWRGTRITILGTVGMTYRVAVDTAVAAGDLRVTVPIEALELGPGYSANVSGGLRIDDLLKDPTWNVLTLQCSDGTSFEKAADFRARVRRERSEARVGQSKGIIKACEKAGAVNVVLFRSDYAGEDYDAGLNVCYVGDLGYTGSPGLVKACTLALRRIRVAGDHLQVVAGDHLQVLPMARAELNVDLDVYLSVSTALVDLARFERIHASSIIQYLNGTGGRFAYSLDGLRGAVVTCKHTPEVQRVVLNTPTTEDSIVSGVTKAFPEVLTRYAAGTITIRYHGPS